MQIKYLENLKKKCMNDQLNVLYTSTRIASIKHINTGITTQMSMKSRKYGNNTFFKNTMGYYFKNPKIYKSKVTISIFHIRNYTNENTVNVSIFVWLNIHHLINGEVFV